ncbi:hypothetical protein BpHYR1_043946 [Brachionus plicatilis]|uniref:Uncharacterized protein n=1 Tax=Brachionus plicatilis TaxID=10195 RepID=A0A3M7RB74_BRAPC|nr:hypothetical protein BpHYR1_043946 [Brachionus plicatilis]
MHHEAFNKLKLLAVSNRLFELSERYAGTGLSHSIPLVVRLVKEYKEGFESRYIEYPTPLFLIFTYATLNELACQVGVFSDLFSRNAFDLVQNCQVELKAFDKRSKKFQLVVVKEW